MSPIDVSILIGVITIVLSLVGSAVIVGVAWGKMRADITNMDRNLAEIKGMFRLTLKE